jgi:hypothetical protein
MSRVFEVTIYVRHSRTCKFRGDESAKKCECWKHLRWTFNGGRHRRKANTRSSSEAEIKKRELEDELLGRTTKRVTMSIREAVRLFIQTKEIEAISDSMLGKYRREFAQLRDYSEGRGASDVHESHQRASCRVLCDLD